MKRTPLTLSVEELAVSVSEVFGGCFIPRPFQPPIKSHVQSYRLINKLHVQERRFMRERAKMLLERLLEVKPPTRKNGAK